MEQIWLLPQAQSESRYVLKLRSLLTVVVLIFTLGISVAIVLARMIRPPNAFSPYSDVFPGQSDSAVKRHQFLCPGKSFEGNASPDYCVLKPTDGIFSHIELNISGGEIHHIAFTLRDNTIKVGDLLVLWGKPDVQQRSDLIGLYWSNHGIVALAEGEISPFLNVWKILFQDSG